MNEAAFDLFQLEVFRWMGVNAVGYLERSLRTSANLSVSAVNSVFSEYSGCGWKIDVQLSEDVTSKRMLVPLPASHRMPLPIV